jgi:alkylation response protein AidB-like acyl-CoA dehydrogenase
MTSTDGVESVDAFRRRARTWIEATLPPVEEPAVPGQQLQATIFDAGFAGIAFPMEYGGAGLTLEHHKVFYDELAAAGRQAPDLMVSVGMIGPTLLDHGSHELKLRFLPKLLRGDETWMQLLSEPRGGSDMAGTTTRLTKDGDTYILNGAKMWSSGAYLSDYGLCLCRSDWEAPKHRGLSTIAVPLQGTPGLTIQRTRAADGELGEFCEESFVDVVLPAENLIGEENEGWSVAQGLLLHERNAVGNIGHGYFGPRRRQRAEGNGFAQLAARASERGEVGDGARRQLLADVYVENTIAPMASERIMVGMRTGALKGQWGSLLKLTGAVAGLRQAKAALAISGAGGVIWDGDEVRLDNPGTAWLGARGGTLAGGSNEMQRNIVTERLLGLPREPSFDRDAPFNEVIRNQGKS